MLGLLSQRLLTVLQLTRMALVFTAIADSLCALSLWARWRAGQGQPLWTQLDVMQLSGVAAMSIGLYGFGMSLNDITDRRRDRQLASHRPLPSGRIGLPAAHVVCAVLALTAAIGGAIVAMRSGAPAMSTALFAWTGALIVFYDFAGKYLVAPGLLTLG
ncbi:MAG: UbiA family prenyltransferase, partial [Tepidisphaeraceae bacterium]